jgi:GNAT superfamily N-acetyltransferase
MLPSQLAEYAAVPIAFRVTHRVARADSGQRAPLREVLVPESYEKDYDALAGGSPREWAARFDLSHWGLFAARRDGVLLGGAAVAPVMEVMADVELPRGAAALWDLRVAPARRGEGIGTALFRAAERWALDRRCAWLVVETQDVNVAACRFYEAMGCRLASFEEDGYADVPGEARLIWHRRLHSGQGSST